MRKLVVFLCCVISSSLFAMQEQALDKIVAIVNDEIVTKSELNQALNIVKLQNSDPYNTPLAGDALQKQTLDQLINKKLQLQLAKQAGIKITDKDVDQAIQNIAQQNHVDSEMLYERISHEGIARTDYRNEIREQMLLHKVQQQELMGRFHVSSNEAKQYMQQMNVQHTGPKSYQLLDILIPYSEAPTTAESNAIRQHALNIYKQLKDGKPLEDVSKEASTAGLSLQSDDLGMLRLAELPAAFAPVAAKLHRQEFSTPIAAGNGYHILQLVDVKQEGAKAQVTLKEAQELLLQKKFEEAMQTWLSKLRGQAYIVMKG